MSAAASGTIRQSVCRWCFASMPLEELCRAARAIGLDSVELLAPDEWPVAAQFGLTCAMAAGAGPITEGFNRRENHEQLVRAYGKVIAAAGAAGIPNVVCFSGNRSGLDDEEGLRNCAIGLERLLPAAERAGVTLCMELLNSKVDHPDYQCDRSAWGIALVRRLGSERFRLLYDVYHAQIMEGDVIRTIRENHEFFAHYHTAGCPGRHEFTRPDLDVQELNYRAIFRAIRATGFQGFIGHEFLPTRDPLTSLREAVTLAGNE